MPEGMESVKMGRGPRGGSGSLTDEPVLLV